MNYPNVEELRVFRWWKRKQRHRYFRMFVLITVAVIAVTYVLWYAGFDTFRRNDLIFGLASLGLFQVIALYQFALCVKMFSKKIDQCWAGVVTEKYKEKYPNKRLKCYRITAKTSAGEMDAVCLKKSFYAVKTGSRVLLFTVGTSKIHCVHLDQK